MQTRIQISILVTAPDGNTPLSGATVFVPGEGFSKIVAKTKGMSSPTLNADV